MDSLKHCIFLADICAARRSYAALKFRGFVRDYVAVKVGKNEDLEIGAPLFVNELCGCDVDIPLVCCDFGIFLANLFAEIEELAVGCLDNICFLDNRNSVLVVSPCIVIGKSCDSLSAFCGGNDEIHCIMYCNFAISSKPFYIFSNSITIKFFF